MGSGTTTENGGIRPTGSSIPRIEALDGIRGFGIVCIVSYHVCQKILPGSFIMVDMFFVLSGFLIASIILSDLRRHVFSFREFYLRRMQRLFPNLLVTVLVTMLLWRLFFSPGEQVAVGRHGLFSIFSLSNVYAWRYLGGYWGDSAESAPLTHMWSLGLEEQFYLFYPMFIFLLFRLRRRKMFLWAGMLALASFACSVLCTPSFATASFYLPPTRLWEMLAGALPALWRMPRADGSLPVFFRRAAAEPVGVAGLSLIAASSLFLDKQWLFPGYIAFIPIFGTVLLILAVADGGNRVSSALSCKPLVVLGQASYSLYLWHWPLITLCRHLAVRNGYSELHGAVLGCVLGVTAGFMAYQFVEKPLRRRDSGRALRIAITALLCPLSAAASAALVFLSPVKSAGGRFDPVVFSGLDYSCGKRDDGYFVSGARVRGVAFPVDKDVPPDLWQSGGLQHFYGGNVPQVVVFGSSHAEMYSCVIDEICREHGISVAFLCVGNGSSALYDAYTNRKDLPTRQIAHEFDLTRAKYLAQWHPDLVLIIDKWDRYAGGKSNFGKRLSSFLEVTRKDAQHIVYVAQAPVLNGLERSANLQEYVTWYAEEHGRRPVFTPDGNEEFRRDCTRQAMAIADADPQFSVLDPESVFYAEDGSVRYIDGRKFLYIDNNHLSDYGAGQTRDLFSRVILRHVGNESSSGSGSVTSITQ